MTFREGVRIDTSTTRTSGGRGTRGMAIGGGVGGLVILLLALLLGVDPGGITSQQGYNTQDVNTPGFDSSVCRTGADANRIVQCRVIATGNSVDAVWDQLWDQYTRPGMVLFSGSVNTACGTATSEVGPFYCPADKTAYFDTDFFEVLKSQFGSSGGPLAQMYVVAHEYGHHVQNLLGTLAQAQRGPQGAEGNSVRTELQADCFAGVWAHYAAVTNAPGSDEPYLEPLTDADIADALSAAQAVGDDRIQQAATGRVNPEAWTHGSASQRQHWFTVGYQTGNPNKCNTYGMASLDG